MSCGSFPMVHGVVVFFLFWGGLWVCTAGSVRRKAHESLSFRATFADGRNRVSTCCEPYGGGSVPELSNYCAQPLVFSQWSDETNPPDKQLGRLTFFQPRETSSCLRNRKPVFKIIANLSHGFGEFNNNKKWRLSRCSVWSCCVIKNIHVNTGDWTRKSQVSETNSCSIFHAD